MVTQRVLVDMDILIDVLRLIASTIAILQATEALSMLCISAVTQMELIVGCRNARELKNLERFLQQFKIISITEAISKQAAQILKQYRLSHGLLIPDALIAATSLVPGYPLLTKNQRDYHFIHSLNLLPFNSSLESF